MPCLANFWPWLSPAVPGGTTKLAWPRARSSGSTTAVITWTSASPPLVAQVLVPLSTHSSVASSYVARVRMAPTSEPASGSEEQNAAILRSPGLPNICGAHSPTCSSVPFARSPAAARAVPTIESPIPASPQNSSSIVIGMPSPVSSKLWVAKKSSEYSPILAASSSTGHGNSSRSSHSAATGRTTFAAKSCTHDRRSRWSRSSSKEGVVTPRG